MLADLDDAEIQSNPLNRPPTNLVLSRLRCNSYYNSFEIFRTQRTVVYDNYVLRGLFGRRLRSIPRPLDLHPLRLP